MRGDTFISLAFLDQISSADFFFKNFQTFLEVKIYLRQSGYFDTLPSPLSLIKVAPRGL